MTARARDVRSTHDPDGACEPVLPRYEAFIGGAAETGCDGLARSVHLPVATVRGALSSFADARDGTDCIRVCIGTSCSLAGADAIAAALSELGPCRDAQCLGYCDRSPTALTRSGAACTQLRVADALRVAAGQSLPAPAPSSVRCVARTPIVTERLLAPAATIAYDGLARALSMPPDTVVQAILDSRLRGRGGAAFSTGTKWRHAAQATGAPKFVVANGDEGDPGSFIDRELMERDPHAILEGMAICGHAIGASRGIVFIRSEYPRAALAMTEAIARASARGLIGADSLGPGRPFHVEVVRGLGSYVCGEETALLAAIEGHRGEVWPRPPYPTSQGLFGRPTVVDNVETLANVPWILREGAAAFAAMGTAESAGTKAVCLNHGFARPGIVEVEFGTTLQHIIDELGGGAAEAELEAVLLGGPMGSIVPRSEWHVPMCFTAMGRRGINLGHAGLVALPVGTDWAALLRHLVRFMRDESCGKCVPCRHGSQALHDLVSDGLEAASMPLVERLLDVMRDASLCAFGRETPGPVRAVLARLLASTGPGVRP